MLGDLNINYYLPPLVFAISLVYSGTRFESWWLIWIHALRWALYILTFLGATYGVLYILSLDLPAMWYVVVVVAVFAAMLLSGRSKRSSPAEPVPNEPPARKHLG
jgi:hypothetical protein